MNVVECDVPLRWSDTDAYGHVNNVAILALVEQARVLFFAQARGAGGESLSRLGGDGLGRNPAFITGQRIEYRRPVRLDLVPVRFRMWVTAIGGADFTLAWELRQHDALCAVGTVGLVFMTGDGARPRRITHDERAVLDAHVGEAPRMRH